MNDIKTDAIEVCISETYHRVPKYPSTGVLDRKCAEDAQSQLAALIARVKFLEDGVKLSQAMYKTASDKCTDLERENAELKKEDNTTFPVVDCQHKTRCAIVEQARREGYAMGRDFAARDYVDRVHGNSHPNTTYDEALAAQLAQAKE